MVHVDLTLVLRINSIIDVLRVLYVVPRPRRKVLYFSDAVRNGYVERVAARPRAERGDEYPVAWLRHVEHCRKAHHAGARVSVPHLGQVRPCFICSLVNPSVWAALVGNLPFGWWNT